MTRFVAILLAVAVPISTGADNMPEVTRSIVSPAVVLSVVDGDTVNLAFLGSRSFVGGVRLRGVLAKESSPLAKEHLAILLPRLTRVRVSQTYSVEGNGTESLCRPVVDVWVEKTGKHINEAQTKYLKEHRLWGGTGTP